MPVGNVVAGGPIIGADVLAELAALQTQITALQARLPYKMRKTIANEVAITGTTFAADNTLFTPTLTANATYDVDLLLFHMMSSTGDITIRWTLPTGATLDWGMYGSDPAIGVTTSIGSAEFRNRHSTSSPTTALVLGSVTDGTGLYANVRGTLLMGSTAGVLALQAAQNTAAGNSTIKSGSLLTVTPH